MNLVETNQKEIDGVINSESKLESGKLSCSESDSNESEITSDSSDDASEEYVDSSVSRKRAVESNTKTNKRKK